MMPLVVFDFNAPFEDFPTITVYDSGENLQFETAAQTVGNVLSDLGIYESNIAFSSYPFYFPLYNGMNIRVVREVPFYASIDGGTPARFTTRHGTTIAQIVADKQIIHDVALLYEYDINRKVRPEDVIELFTWRNRYYTEMAVVPFEIIENHTPNIRYGRTYAGQRGSDGEHELVITVTYIGGVEQSRKISDEIVHIAAVPAMYDVGTGALGALADTSAEEFRYVRRVRMQATAYCACFRCTGRRPGDRGFGITASGRRVEHGIVAVDRSVIALGTHLYVAGYGFALAADVGGAIVGNRIDLFMYDHQDALTFGRRYVYVYVLD